MSWEERIVEVYYISKHAYLPRVSDKNVSLILSDDEFPEKIIPNRKTIFKNFLPQIPGATDRSLVSAATGTSSSTAAFVIVVVWAHFSKFFVESFAKVLRFV